MNATDYTLSIDQTSSADAINQNISSDHQPSLSIIFSPICPISNRQTATIIVSPAIVTALFDLAALSQQPVTQTHGFIRGEVPVDYIKQNFKESLLNHLKELLLKQVVIHFLYQQIREQRTSIADNPHLSEIRVTLEAPSEFIFEFTAAPNIGIDDWKHLPFKAPRRKNYKDLDRQVETFLTQERQHLSTYNSENGLQLGDWVHFELDLIDHASRPLNAHLKQQFFFKLSPQDGECTLREIFVGKKKQEIFITDSFALQNYYSTNLATNYFFEVTILDIIPHAFFCVDLFKSHFRLKTNKDIHQKCIEVFSFRNDICLRRSLVQETLKLLLAKNPFSIPEHVIQYQEKIVLENVRQNSDYNIYRIQKDFYHQVKQLAKQQARELILTDQFTAYEDLTISDGEVKAYLNFFNRPRMKEFIYFGLPPYKIQGQEVPIAANLVKQSALREKTVNHLIYHLTKR